MEESSVRWEVGRHYSVQWSCVSCRLASCFGEQLSTSEMCCDALFVLCKGEEFTVSVWINTAFMDKRNYCVRINVITACMDKRNYCECVDKYCVYG
jgi:hypothetical protein